MSDDQNFSEVCVSYAVDAATSNVLQLVQSSEDGLHARIVVEIERAVSAATLRIREDALSREQVLLQHARWSEEQSAVLRAALMKVQADLDVAGEQHTETLAELNGTLTRKDNEIAKLHRQLSSATDRATSAEYELRESKNSLARAQQCLAELEAALRAKNAVLVKLSEKGAALGSDEFQEKVRTALRINPESGTLSDYLSPALTALLWAKSDPTATERTRREASAALEAYENVARVPDEYPS